ncbi:MAG: hypothetical protein IEMM0002_0805 [bacterium]|nr:MAG: hypothetical protein IEMM0002_0805 [bacterium]
MFYNWSVKVIIVFMVAAAVSWGDASAEEDGGFDVGSTFAASGADKVQWHGYYEFENVDAEGANSTMDAHKITVWMGVPINEMVFLSSEIEYEHFPRLRDTGERDGGSGEIKIDSSQLSIMPVENFRGYLGVYYVPFGIEYLSYPGFKNKLVTRPKVMKSGGIIPGTWSATGIGFSNAFSGVGQLDILYINGDAKNGGISRDSKAGGNEGKSLGARFMLDGLIEGFNIGGSYISGKWDSNDAYESTRFGAHMRIDADVITGNAMFPVLIGEYVSGKDEQASSVTGSDKRVSGYYAQLSSRVTSLVELAVRYGQYDNDEEKTDNRKTETSIGFALHPLDNFQIKGEYQWNDERGTKKDNNALAFEAVAFW